MPLPDTAPDPIRPQGEEPTKPGPRCVTMRRELGSGPDGTRYAYEAGLIDGRPVRHQLRIEGRLGSLASIELGPGFNAVIAENLAAALRSVEARRG